MASPYLGNCVKYGFTQWRIHQAIVVLIAGVGGFVFKDWFSAHQLALAIPVYLFFWLLIYTLVVVPAFLWHQQDEDYAVACPLFLNIQTIMLCTLAVSIRCG